MTTNYQLERCLIPIECCSFCRRNQRDANFQVVLQNGFIKELYQLYQKSNQIMCVNAKSSCRKFMVRK